MNFAEGLLDTIQELIKIPQGINYLFGENGQLIGMFRELKYDKNFMTLLELFNTILPNTIIANDNLKKINKLFI